MGFKEFSNPESTDYDIKSSIVNFFNQVNLYSEELFNLIDLFDDVSAVDLRSQYGISFKECFSPTAETIEKVKNKVNGKSK